MVPPISLTIDARVANLVAYKYMVRPYKYVVRD